MKTPNTWPPVASSTVRESLVPLGMSPICPTCGCSLVRLGIEREDAARYEHRGEELLFCCQSCVELFRDHADTYLAQIRDWSVCPTCLAEKPEHLTVSISHEGQGFDSVVARTASKSSVGVGPSCSRDWPDEDRTPVFRRLP